MSYLGLESHESYRDALAVLRPDVGLQVTYCIHHQFGSEGDPKSLEALDLGDVVRHCGRR